MIYTKEKIVIDDSINLEEYERIISNNKGLRHSFKNKESKRFLQFYLNAKKRGISFNI